MSAKKQLLDPLGALCKLVSLNFSEINTKISIHNHSLSLQKPYNYQFMVRWMNGDGKENVSELYHVISRVIKWYMLNDNDNSEIYNCDELKRLVRYLCNAFRKLQETYEYGNVILAVQFYINIMESAINGNYNDNMLPKYILDKEKEYENLLDYDKLKNFWKYDKLKRICELYDACFKVYNSEDMLLIEKEALINGYLQSIQSILEITDGEFHKLIQNSTKG
ncbi:hypothetical protein Klosneuvirus_1_281 [Klosneuvirus KNV1]|uniref:Uncharacterized protein n=1 Tax=Klosneuvirus KNV1 TaxID=1977640 RepID=A0A1V0SIF6_9VIRU|nr:hypothetical protein Klosneuvirus_1_281 [Klosneuvirus KNV1]